MGEEQIKKIIEGTISRKFNILQSKILDSIDDSRQNIVNNLDSLESNFNKINSDTITMIDILINYFKSQNKANLESGSIYEYPNTYLPPRSINLQKRIK